MQQTTYPQPNDGLEGLISIITSRKTTTRRGFRFTKQIEPKEAYFALKASYIAEVRLRGFEFNDSAEIDEKFKRIALIMVSHTSKNCILFCGAPGNGKTTMMNAFADVIEIFANRGYWENFNTKMNIFDAVDLCQFDSKDLLEISNRYIIGIEDMGREPTDTVTFGDICSPISRLLERRYERQLPTIISANLTPAQIRDKYGNRIADRFNEMTAIINFKDASYRGRSQPLTAPGSGSATETETKTSTGRKA